MSKICADQFKAYIQAKPATTIALGLMLLACRQKSVALVPEVAVYFSRSFGSDYFANWLMEEVEPALTSEECIWMWQVLNGKIT